MGPRPRGRGITVRRATVRGEPAPFNGAATARSRNYWNGDGMYFPPSSFNGAATARSRNWGGGSAPIFNTYALQWGRDRAVAELFAGDCTHYKCGRPSMGPRPRGRGILSCSAHDCLHRFPSMGPRPRGRGIPLPATGTVYNPPPSMGPRPRGRGILLITLLVCDLLDTLQWGRDRAVAELNVPGLSWNAPFPAFNGAATARSRNFFDASQRCRNRYKPSMGPRPRGRGILARWLVVH